jgi:hypothetical protein
MQTLRRHEDKLIDVHELDTHHVSILMKVDAATLQCSLPICEIQEVTNK